METVYRGKNMVNVNSRKMPQAYIKQKTVSILYHVLRFCVTSACWAAKKNTSGDIKGVLPTMGDEFQPESIFLLFFFFPFGRLSHRCDSNGKYF